MRGHDHGHAAVREVTDNREHFADKLGVEGGGRLVEEHDLGVHGKGAGNGDALLLPAGKLGGVERGTLGEAHAAEFGQGAVAGFGLVAAHDLAQGDGDVLLGGEVIEQVEVLKDHADLLPQGAQFPCVAGVDLLPLKPNVAGVRGQEVVEALEERAFAGTGRADDHFHVAFVHIEGHVVEDRFAAEFLDDVGGAQDRGGVHGDVPHMEPLTA